MTPRVMRTVFIKCGKPAALCRATQATECYKRGLFSHDLFSPRVAAADLERLVEFGREFLEETAGREQHAAGAGARRNFGKAKVEFVLRAGDGDIKQPSLFVEIA